MTPFVLKRVAEITGGASLEANMALIKNNAAVGAELAVEVRQVLVLDVPTAKVPQPRAVYGGASFRPGCGAKRRSDASLGHKGNRARVKKFLIGDMSTSYEHNEAPAATAADVRKMVVGDLLASTAKGLGLEPLFPLPAAPPSACALRLASASGR